MEERHADVVQRKLPAPPTRSQSRQHHLQSPHQRSVRVVLWCATVGELPGHNPRPHCALVLSVASQKSPVEPWKVGHNGVPCKCCRPANPEGFPTGKRRPMSATQPVGGVMTRHEFVVNGWTKALVSADPFCRLQTRTSTRQLNGHDHGKVPAPTARAEVEGEVCLPARLTPPAEECTGAFRSFCLTCCLVRSVGWDRAAATQGGRRSKGWPQDRFSSGRGRG